MADKSGKRPSVSDELRGGGHSPGRRGCVVPVFDSVTLVAFGFSALRQQVHISQQLVWVFFSLLSCQLCEFYSIPRPTSCMTLTH